MLSPKFLFVGNGRYQNRGCEAITLGTIEILRKAFGDDISIIDIPYADPNSPVPSWFTRVGSNYEYHPRTSSPRLSKGWWIRNALRIAPKLRNRCLNYQSGCGLLSHLESATAVLALGGDNYSFDYGIPYGHLYNGKFVRKHNIPFFIWGGSIGPFNKKFDFTNVILEHLRHEVSGIFTREQRSYDYLVKNGVKNTQMMSDPAFVMEPEPVSSDQLGFEMPENAIGINLSPIMRRYCHQGNMIAWQKNAHEIIQAIRKHFDNPIVLIPHVTIGSHNNDHLFMESCLEGIKSDDRIYSIDARLDARQTKWVISKLSCLVAARTHATIAAFSTCTPTVSLAYSVKAFGLNEVLFGHTDYLVPPSTLSAETVLSTTKKAMDNSAIIRDKLESIMPTIREDAYRPGKWLKQRTEKRDFESNRMEPMHHLLSDPKLTREPTRRVG